MAIEKRLKRIEKKWEIRWETTRKEFEKRKMKQILEEQRRNR